MKPYVCAALAAVWLIGCRTALRTEDSVSLGADAADDYKNYSGSVICKNSFLVEASSVEKIQQVVKTAAAEGRNIRVVSLDASRSYSPVICPESGGIVLNVKGLNRLVSVDKDSQTAVVEPGLLINELQDKLDIYGLTFPVTPDYNGVSIAGGMATGAHHSSLRIPSEISEWIEEINLVDGQGNLRKLNGNQMDLGRVHLGLLGVIYQLKLRVVPQFKVKYGFTKLPDENLESTIENLVRPHDYARVMWFPSQKTIIVDHFDKVPSSTSGDSYSNLWTSTPPIPQINTFAVNTLNSGKLTQCAAEALRVRTFGGQFKVVDSDSDAPVGWSHKMLAGSCPNGACSWDKGVNTRTVEVGFPLSQVGDWIKDVRALVAARRACFPVLGIYMRFSAASTSALGQAGGRDTVLFEIHIPQGPKPMLEPSSDVYEEMVQMTLMKYNGRPHWGKNSMPYFLNLSTEQYPKFGEFEELRLKLDPAGSFTSPFWKNIRAQTQPVPTEGCAVTRECICASDSDCGLGARCEAGVVFKEARVCRKN